MATSLLKTSLKEFLGSPAFQRHLQVAAARAADLPGLLARFTAYLRGEEDVDALRVTLGGAVDVTLPIDGGAQVAVWGFGGPGTARFFETLCEVADRPRLDAELRQAVEGAERGDLSDRLRRFASFVAETARRAGVGPESNLHVGYATCFITFLWHVMLGLEVPVFYGASHKGMKSLIGAGAVDEPAYGSRDLAQRFEAFLRITRSLRDLLQRVNPHLSYWTVEAFLDWFAARSDVTVEESGTMAPLPAHLQPDEIGSASLATIDPNLVAGAIDPDSDDDVDDDDDMSEVASAAAASVGWGPGRGGTDPDKPAHPEAATPPGSGSGAWYDGRVLPAEAGIQKEPEPHFDPSAIADPPLVPAGRAKLGRLGRGKAPERAPEPELDDEAIPGLMEFGPGEGLLDSTAGSMAPIAPSLPDPGPPAASEPLSIEEPEDDELSPPHLEEDDDDDDDDEVDLEADDEDDEDDEDVEISDRDLEPALASSAFRVADIPGLEDLVPTDVGSRAPALDAGPPRAPRRAEDLTGPGGDTVRLDEAGIVTLAASLLLPEDEVKDMLRLLERRGQLALEGPSGTGKTYAARLLAAAFAGTPDRVRAVQLHPAFRYEAFVEAPVPGATPGAHGAAPGLFVAFAEAARRSPTKRYVLILDDVGRGDPVAVLGECLTLLEQRGEEMMLPFSRTAFSVPENLFVIATSGVGPSRRDDAAFRRRFPHVRLEPSADVLRRFLEARRPAMEWVADLFAALNERLAALGGPDARLGHAVLMRDDLDDDELARIWRYDILPEAAARVGREHEDELCLEALRGAVDAAA